MVIPDIDRACILCSIRNFLFFFPSFLGLVQIHSNLFEISHASLFSFPYILHPTVIFFLCVHQQERETSAKSFAFLTSVCIIRPIRQGVLLWSPRAKSENCVRVGRSKFVDQGVKPL